jgi:outer membrane lipase/esterase
MRFWNLVGVAAAALMVAACGGGGGEAVSSKVSFSGAVNFGDSLSDVGSYKVGTVAAVGGGKFTVNGTTAQNWTEILAKTYQLAAPCPAQTGLDGNPALGLSVPVVNNATCFSYAQGGARVTNPVGPGNKLLGGTNAALGQLTVPVSTQMSNHLAKVGGSYKGTELVTVMAGGNDLFIQMGVVGATADAVLAGKAPASALDTAIQNAGLEMGKAGAELAGYVKALVLGKGAKTVVVVNLPNVSKTPYALAQSAQTQALVDSITKVFNEQLAKGLAGTGVVLADAYTESSTQAANPAPYGLTDVTTPACSKTSPANPLGGQSLTCSANSTIAGDTSRYQYADDVHPTPFGYELLAKFVLSEMLKAGLL